MFRSEAWFWETHVFDRADGTEIEQTPWAPHVSAETVKKIKELQAMRLRDPFDKNLETTRDNALYSAKLDWLLLPADKTKEILQRQVTGEGLSDHKCLMVDLVFA